MAAITAQMVKELRDKTDAGMGECKKALVETDGNMEAAIDYLRKAGIAKAENRAEKATKEGKVYVAVDGGNAVMLEILCETDFVANNEKEISSRPFFNRKTKFIFVFALRSQFSAFIRITIKNMSASQSNFAVIFAFGVCFRHQLLCDNNQLFRNNFLIHASSPTL